METYEDCNSLVEQIHLQEKEARHKRRWLIGLSVPNNEEEVEDDRTMPECLLREDDVFYDTVKSFVEKRVGGCNTQDNMQLSSSLNDVKGLLYIIDDMTNKGLCDFAEVLTGEPVKFEKTRWKMKKFIKECVSKLLQKQSSSGQMNLSENHSSLLKNPHNFRWNSESRFIPDSQSRHAAVLNILDRLEELPTQTLSAMHRKLRGKAYIPQLMPKKLGWGRDTLIKSVKKKCMKLLSQLGEGDELQEPLAKAMEVASLTLKLIQGCHYIANFRQLSCEINALQNEIAMSIRLLDYHTVKFTVLKDLQLLLDANANLSERSLRTSMKYMLTEYLFECSDMDTIPDSLLKVLAIIRESSEVPYKQLLEMKIEEEVEYILNVSASTKQVLWDLIPKHGFDLEFADAYMEDLEESEEESDSDDIYEDIEQEVKHVQNNRYHSSNLDEGVGSTEEIKLADCDSDEEIESAGEINSVSSDSAAFLTQKGSYSLKSEVPNTHHKGAMMYYFVTLRNMERMDTGSPTFTNNQSGSQPPSSDKFSSRSNMGRQETTHISEKNPDLVSSNFSSAERNSIFNNEICKNQYLALQAASDETSMVAYRLIGRILDNFAQIEGYELSSSDALYLEARGHDSVQEECTEPTHEEDGCSVITKALEELIPSFAQRSVDS